MDVMGGLKWRKIKRRELQEMEANKISFIIIATYDMLSSPRNIQQWLEEDPTYVICLAPVILKHIITVLRLTLHKAATTGSIIRSSSSWVQMKCDNILPQGATNPLKTKNVPKKDMKVQISF